LNLIQFFVTPNPVYLHATYNCNIHAQLLPFTFGYLSNSSLTFTI